MAGTKRKPVNDIDRRFDEHDEEIKEVRQNLHSLRDEVQHASVQLAEFQAESKANDFHQNLLLADIKKTLVGEGDGEECLRQITSRHERFINNCVWVLKMVITPILGAVGVAIILATGYVLVQQHGSTPAPAPPANHSTP